MRRLTILKVSVKFCPQLTFTFSKPTVRNNRKRREICSELTKKTRRRSGVFIVNFERISYLFLVFFFVDFEHVNVNWVRC